MPALLAALTTALLYAHRCRHDAQALAAAREVVAELMVDLWNYIEGDAV